MPRGNLLMMKTTPNQRLRAARKKAGFSSAAKAAARFGWNTSTYRSHENGQTQPGADDAEKYAHAFKVEPDWIMFGDKPRRADPPHTVPVHGYVGAGAGIDPFEDTHPIDHIELPALDDQLQCVVVRGLSMYPRYFDGEKLLYSAERRSPARLVGEECVVRLTNGQMLVKIIRRGSRKTLFNLESWNAPLLEDQAIDWASPIIWSKR